MERRNDKPARRKLLRRKTTKTDVAGKLSALPKKPPSPPLLRPKSQQREPNGKAPTVTPRLQSTDIVKNDSSLPADTQSQLSGTSAITLAAG